MAPLVEGLRVTRESGQMPATLDHPDQTRQDADQPDDRHSRENRLPARDGGGRLRCRAFAIMGFWSRWLPMHHVFGRRVAAGVAAHFAPSLGRRDRVGGVASIRGNDVDRPVPACPGRLLARQRELQRRDREARAVGEEDHDRADQHPDQRAEPEAVPGLGAVPQHGPGDDRGEHDHRRHQDQGTNRRADREVVQLEAGGDVHDDPLSARSIIFLISRASSFETPRPCSIAMTSPSAEPPNAVSISRRTIVPRVASRGTAAR